MKSNDELERIASAVIDSVVCVHHALGPGLLESAYQHCLAYELGTRGMDVELELALPVRYGPVVVDAGYRIDMLVERAILIENKSVQAAADPRRATADLFEALGMPPGIPGQLECATDQRRDQAHGSQALSHPDW